MIMTRHNMKPWECVSSKGKIRALRGAQRPLSVDVAVTKRGDRSGVEDEDRELQQGRGAGGIHW